LAWHAASQRWRATRIRLARITGSVSPLRGVKVQRLLLVPQDLRTCDPTIAADIYAGYFALSGRMVAMHGRSAFEIQPPSMSWAEELMGFGWLRHLRAADTPLARANAQALVDDFLHAGAQRSEAGRRPRVIARRLMSLLSQSPLVLDGADHNFYRRFLRCIERDIANLASVARAMEGEDRLTVAIALVYASLSIEDMGKVFRQADRLFVTALSTQVLRDGCPMTRSPRMLVELLADLLPLRQAYLGRAMEPPAAIQKSIDRMVPMLRLLRHGDGNLALFHGMDLGTPDLVATLLAYDDQRGNALMHAPYGGYERLEAGGSVVVVDTGPPPPPAFSMQAHASALAFEFSAGPQRIIINCGTPRGSAEAARQAVRRTQAHSTLSLGDASSCIFSTQTTHDAPAPAIVAGPGPIEVERRHLADGSVRIMAAQDGYRARFGLTHSRSLVLSGDGSRLSGEDRLDGEPGTGAGLAALLRFHLHPSVQASRIDDGRRVMLVMTNGDAWEFATNGPDVALEESVFFAAPDGVRRCEQIVVTFAADAGVRLVWSLSRLGRTKATHAEKVTVADDTPTLI
jgi:uncharacterized heparinase superfamily protein